MYPDEKVIKVTTCVPLGLWKQAQFNNLKWCDALAVGIKVLSGVNNELTKIEEKLRQMENEKEVLMIRRQELKKEEEEKELAKKKNVVMEF